MCVFEEDIGRLEVSMHHPECVQAFVAFDDLFDHSDGVTLMQFFLGLDVLAKIASIAVVGDDVGLILVGVDLLDIEQVWAILDHVQNLNFCLEKVFVDFALHGFHVDDFDGDMLV